MLRISCSLVVLGLVGGCFGATSRDDENEGGGRAGGSVCEGDASAIAAIDRSCESADDCMLVQHTSDCCGTSSILGINAGAKATFVAAEEQCAPAPCDCAPRQTTLEDGTWIPARDASYAVACVSGRCQSVYAGETFVCSGDVVCTEEQYCKLVSDSKSSTTAICEPAADCTDVCECPGVVHCSCEGDERGFAVFGCDSP